MTYRLTPPGAALSDLAAVSPPIQGTDILAVRRSGVDYRATAAQLLAYMQANLTFAGIPPTITTLATSSIGTTTVALTWSEGGGATTSRTVQVRTPSGSGNYSSATTTGSSPGAITVTGLTSSTAYDIQVTVTNTSGSNTATLTNITTSSSLAAPTIASLAHGTVTTTTIPITWTEGGGTVASRTVQIRTPSGSGSYSSATTTGLGNGSATITGLTANTTYDVQVTVTNTTGSNTATMTNTTTAVALAQPTIASLSAGTATSTTIPITWTEGGGTVASRTVQIRTPSGSGSYSSATTTGLGNGSATITGLTASTAYDVQVTLTNATNSATATLTNASTAATATYLSALPTVAAASSGPVVAYDASLLTGSNGSTVATFPDQTTHHVDLTQATSGSRPTLAVAAINGLNALRITTSQQMQNLSAATALSGIETSGFTFYCVAKPLSALDGAAVANMGDGQLDYGPPNCVMWNLDTGNGGGATFSFSADGNGNYTYMGTLSVNTLYVLVGTFDHSAMTIYGYLNNASTLYSGNGVAQPLAFTSLGIGTRQSTYDDRRFDGYLCEWVVWPGTATSSEATAIYNYAHAKWGS